MECEAVCLAMCLAPRGGAARRGAAQMDFDDVSRSRTTERRTDPLTTHACLAEARQQISEQIQARATEEEVLCLLSDSDRLLPLLS